MNRRHFFQALTSGLLVPVVPRRVYSFLWDNPLVATPTPVFWEGELLWYSANGVEQRTPLKLSAGNVTHVTTPPSGGKSEQ